MPVVLDDDDYATLTAPGFMDLHVEVLFREGSKIRIAMSHYYTKNSDLIPDPDMEVLLDTEAEAFQTQFKFTQELRERDPAYDAFLKANYPKAKMLNTLLEFDDVEELYGRRSA